MKMASISSFESVRERALNRGKCRVVRLASSEQCVSLFSVFLRPLLVQWVECYFDGVAVQGKKWQSKWAPPTPIQNFRGPRPKIQVSPRGKGGPRRTNLPASPNLPTYPTSFTPLLVRCMNVKSGEVKENRIENASVRSTLCVKTKRLFRFRRGNARRAIYLQRIAFFLFFAKDCKYSVCSENADPFCIAK